MREVGLRTGSSPQYLNAYLNGIQFVLLALEGKLTRMGDRVSKAEVMEAMYEYHELAMRLRKRVRARAASGEPDSVLEWEADDNGEGDAGDDDSFVQR